MATEIIAFLVNLRKNNNRFNKGYVYFNLFWVRKYKKTISSSLIKDFIGLTIQVPIQLQNYF